MTIDAWTIPGRYDWAVPSTQTITIRCWGGGSDSGARSFVDVVAGEVLTIRVGAHGGHGGYNGGGRGAAPVHLTDTILITAHGSGASDVRQGGSLPEHRVCVGGGRGGFSWYRDDGGPVVPGSDEGTAPPFLGGEGTDTLIGPNLAPNTTDGADGWDATYDNHSPANHFTREAHVAGGGGGANVAGDGPSGHSGSVWESQTDPSYHHPPPLPYVGHDDWLWRTPVHASYSGRSFSPTADYGMTRPSPWEYGAGGAFALVDGLVLIEHAGSYGSYGWHVGAIGFGNGAWT